MGKWCVSPSSVTPIHPLTYIQETQAARINADEAKIQELRTERDVRSLEFVSPRRVLIHLQSLLGERQALMTQAKTHEDDAVTSTRKIQDLEAKISRLEDPAQDDGMDVDLDLGENVNTAKVSPSMLSIFLPLTTPLPQ